jgi:hypothetical protein
MCSLSLAKRCSVLSEDKNNVINVALNNKSKFWFEIDKKTRKLALTTSVEHCVGDPNKTKINKS